jgi:hypothetical protein
MQNEPFTLDNEKKQRHRVVAFFVGPPGPVLFSNTLNNNNLKIVKSKNRVKNSAKCLAVKF